MIIDCVSDLHGHYPELEGGDLLIICGDLTAADKIHQYIEFFEWLKKQKYTKIVYISGNHDVQAMSQFDWGGNVDYLFDSLVEFEGLKIWGTPWTPLFRGVNPLCKAFMLPEDELAAKFALIPDDIDILISHGPPKGCLDALEDYMSGIIEHVGSQSLLEAVQRVKPRVHVFGHIHEHGGKQLRYKRMGSRKPDCKMYNTSYVDERYRPKKFVTRIEL